MNDNISMNSSRPVIAFNEPYSHPSFEERIRQLINQNKSLEETSTKYHTKIMILENQLREINDKNYKGGTNTSSNFYLPSELKNIWESIANENIGDCFIDFFNYPHITFHLIQEMLVIIKSMIKEQLKLFIDTSLSIMNFDINDNDTDYAKTARSFFNTIRPFLQENVKLIFENDKKFNIVFFGYYTKFFNQEIKPMLDDIEEINLSIESFEDIMKSKSFEKMISNIKKILLCIELNDQDIQFDIDNYCNREAKYDSSYKAKEVLNVNGKTIENLAKMVLITPPQMKNGFSYMSLLPIIIQCDPQGNNDDYGNGYMLNKHFVTSPGMSLRSTSYQNIYHYTTTNEKEEGLIAAQHDLFDLRNEQMNNDNENYPLETEVIPCDNNTRTQRYLTNKSHIINALLNKESQVNHIRSLSKSIKDNHNHNHICHTNANMNINPSSKTGYSSSNMVGKSFAEKVIKSNKKPKIYKIKRQGKNIKMQEINPASHYSNKNYLKTKTDDEVISACINPPHQEKYGEDGKQVHNFSTSNSIIEPTVRKGGNYNHGSHGNSKGSTSDFYLNTANNNNNVNVNANSNGNFKRKENKNKSIDRNSIFDYKTNAVTKVNVEDLLSFKPKTKKKLKEYRKTFTSVNTKHQFD